MKYVRTFGTGRHKRQADVTFLFQYMYGEHRKLVLVWFAKMKSYNMTILTGLAT